MPPSVPPHVWTARVAPPTPTQRIRALLVTQLGRIVAGAVLPGAALALVLAGAGATDDAGAAGPVVAAAAPGQGQGGLPTVAEGGLAPRAADVPFRSLPFASVDGIELVLTSPAAKIVGFHQASYPDALTMVPMGRALALDNGSVGYVGAEGPNFVVMSSRGRPTSATSAVDIAQEAGSVVVSPVSGTVAAVSNYALYGRYPDARIELIPEGRPDLRIVVLHVTGPRVGPGQRVEAGQTVVASTATSFPFTSHVDRYAGGRPPHVHVEAKRV